MDAMMNIFRRQVRFPMIETIRKREQTVEWSALSRVLPGESVDTDTGTARLVNGPCTIESIPRRDTIVQVEISLPPSEENAPLASN